MLCDLSRKEFNIIYDRLDIKLKEVGESFYNPMLRDLVDSLIESKVAIEDQGAICIFVGKKKAPPLMIQKSDGGFGYATTDLAAARYRANELKCDRVVYVTDVGQEFHFKQVFEAATTKCAYVDKTKTKLDHMMFGMVLQEEISIDENGNEVKKQVKIKTRAGKSVKLSELLDEARDRALKTFEERINRGKEPAKEGEEEEEISNPKVQI